MVFSQKLVDELAGRYQMTWALYKYLTDLQKQNATAN